MRVIVALGVGAAVGALLMLGVLLASSALVEYRSPPFDFGRLAADKCEPVNSPGAVLYFRCPRFVIR